MLLKFGFNRDIAFTIEALVFEQNKQLLREKKLKEVCNGTSRSSIKRRAKFLRKCRICGKIEHSGRCGKNITQSQSECLNVIKKGTIRWLTENPDGLPRLNSNATFLGYSLLERYVRNLEFVEIEELETP